MEIKKKKEKKKKKKKKLYRSVTRTYTYRTSFRTEITKLINATNKASFTLFNWFLMESSLHRLVNLMKGNYYAYVEKIKYNMSRIDIFITFVTLHSIYPICSFACHFTHNTGKMCNDHTHLKK